MILEQIKELVVSDQEEFLPTVPAVTELTTNQPTTQQPFFPTRADQPLITTQFSTRLTPGENATNPTSLPLNIVSTQSPRDLLRTVITTETVSQTSQKPTFTIPQKPTRVFSRPIPELPRSRNQSPRKLDTVSNIRNIIDQTNKQSASLLGEDKQITPSTFRGRNRSQPRLPLSRKQDQQDLRNNILTGQDLTQELFSRNKPNRPLPLSPIASITRKPVTIQSLPAEEDNSIPEYEYEYYYEYLDDRHDKPNSEYDLVPLANKVRILDSGEPHCLDVGVFPHPFSCKMFVNCYRNPGSGIQGSIYQCPSYLAFDPVGGRCNWVNEIVCSTPSR